MPPVSCVAYCRIHKCWSIILRVLHELRSSASSSHFQCPHVFLRSFSFLLSCVKNNNLNNKTPHFGKRTGPEPQAKNTVKLSLLVRTRYVQLSSDIDLFMTRLIQINNVAIALKQDMNISKSEYDVFFLVAVSPQKFAKSKRAVFW